MAATLAQLLSEFFGTFALISAVVLNSAGGSALGVTAIAFTLMVCIYAVGDVSGAHFNPAVSITLGLAGKLPVPSVCMYIVAQCLGGVFAGVASGFLVHSGYAESSWPHLVQHDNMWPVVGCEVFYTAMLSLVVACVAATKQTKGNQYYGLAIGLVIVAGGHATGKVSGGCLNPAVALGIFACDQGGNARSLLWLLAGELLGAGLAFIFYHLLHPEEFSGDAVEGYESSLNAKCVGEFLGTFYLVLTVGLDILSGDLLAAWSIAASLAAMIYAVGSVSGGHLNPAVTVALVVRRRAPEAPGKYLCAQFSGGILAALVAKLLGPQVPQVFLGLRTGLKFSTVAAANAEVFATLLLCFAVLSVASVPGKDVGSMVGLVVGSCVTVGGFAIGAVSGASLNPAVSAGLACTGALEWPKEQAVLLPVYVAAELVGGLLAAALFAGVRPGSFSEDKPLLNGAERAEQEGYGAPKNV